MIPLFFAKEAGLYKKREKSSKKQLQFSPMAGKIGICTGKLCKIISSSEEVFGLPNIKSAKKRVLVNKTKAAQNKAAKSALKTDIKKFEAAVVEGNRSEAEGAYKVAVKAVDKAVVKGLLHKNNAAHKKSAMTIKLNKLA